MEIRSHLRTPETDEVLRRVGRNVVSFQCVEDLLKRLTVHYQPVVPISKMQAERERHSERVNLSTMGTLALKLRETVLRSPTEKPVPQHVDEEWVGFRFGIEGDAKFVDDHDREMQALVDARNDLIHHFLPRWHASVGGDAVSACDYLDSQHAEIKRVMVRLQGWVNSMDKNRAVIVGFMNSPEYERQSELMSLQGSSLVALLRGVSTRAARSDGWTDFSKAADVIRREAPDELVDVENRFGLPDLKSVLLASEFFDVVDEKLPKGRTRLIYRISDR